MNIYKAKVCYKGSAYSGWQIQKSEKTIQAEINKALTQICKSDDVKSVGSGRTDAGVHANGQVFRMQIPLQIEPNSLTKALNSLLPTDIRILETNCCDETFHPIHSALSKDYHYLFTNLETANPLLKDLMHNTSYQLDTGLMEKACQCFIGKHDFVNFFCTGTPVNSTVREIFKMGLSQHTSEPYGVVFYKIEVRGSGFLKQMVRLMAGAVLAVGSKKITTSDLEKALSQKMDKKLSAVAPACGLYLNHVEY